MRIQKVLPEPEALSIALAIVMMIGMYCALILRVSSYFDWTEATIVAMFFGLSSALWLFATGYMCRSDRRALVNCCAAGVISIGVVLYCGWQLMHREVIFLPSGPMINVHLETPHTRGFLFT